MPERLPVSAWASAPDIAISVGTLDTGIDVPAVVNPVFAKPVSDLYEVGSPVFIGLQSTAKPAALTA